MKPTSMAKKLAIVISGAVSLGSYEAGVMYELLEAISLHNEMLETDDPNRVVIDVITGASAGAMTAAILSYQLYYGGSSLRKPYDNPMFKAWVQDVNIDSLLDVKREDHKFSLLSSKVVDQIGKTYLPDTPSSPIDLHPTASDDLRIGLAMSNLNGFSQSIEGHVQDVLVYSRYKDQFVCQLRFRQPQASIELSELEPQECGGQVVWRTMTHLCSWAQLRYMALSSGSFPFAFRARRIGRHGGSPQSLMRNRDSPLKSTAGDALYGGDYLYTDGGVFENEPVGLAASLVKKNDNSINNLPHSYLFVAPGKREMSSDPFFNREDNHLAMVSGLASAIFGQSRFQEWATRGLQGQLFSVTANDACLIGDVFSAFAGFLEFEFRYHDYNIGRRNARLKLREGAFKDLIGDFLSIDKLLPPIDWPDDLRSKKSSFAPSTSPAENPYADEQIYPGYSEFETESWKQARDGLLHLARPWIVKVDGQDRRDQLQELRNLMSRVDVHRRETIAKQIRERVDSLIDFVNEDYLDRFDASKKFGFAFRMLRNRLGKPLAKLFLGCLVGPFLEDIIINPAGQRGKQ